MDIHVLNPMPFDGIGPSQTCLNLASRAHLQGLRARIYATRRRTQTPASCDFVLPFRNAGSILPHRLAGKMAIQHIEETILKEVPEGALVYAWPAVSATVIETLKARGCLIALEVINLYTETENAIINSEMEAEGLSYQHYVTPEKVRNQRLALKLADVIFCANEEVMASLVDYGYPRERIVLSHYGSSVPSPPEDLEPRDYNATPENYLFVGRINLEKGVHHLLRAWKKAAIPGKLHLYGNVDQVFREHYGDLLAQDSVQLHKFTKAIGPAYAAADCFVFSSLAEGGPQVTVEAASYGLPLVVSRMGGGRIAVHEETALVADPLNADTLADAIRRIATDADLRKRLGQTAQLRSKEFSWENAAKERFTAILENLRGQSRSAANQE